MIEIKKGKEPPELLAHRKTAHAIYENMPKETHQAVLDNLIKEQGGLCAYCMRRIPQKGKDPSATIEHWDAQSKNDKDKALDYRNMLAVCNGNRGCKRDMMTCDARKGDKSLKVNPLNPATLESISYKSDGTIFSTDPEVQNDLQDTLNLNCDKTDLIFNRRDALQAMIMEIHKKKGSGDITQYCSRLLENYCQSQTKTPYVGILIWWLEKKTKPTTSKK